MGGEKGAGGGRSGWERRGEGRGPIKRHVSRRLILW